MLDKMQELGLLDRGMASALGKVFDLIDIAEEEIRAAQKAYPSHREKIWNSFVLLKPRGMFNDLAPIIYKKHCRELLARVVNGEDTRLGTKAEIMISMLETSMRTPMNNSGQHLYEKLFLELFGDVGEDTISPDVVEILQEAQAAHESLGHDFAYAELMRKIGRKLRVEDRKLEK